MNRYAIIQIVLHYTILYNIAACCQAEMDKLRNGENTEFKANKARRGTTGVSTDGVAANFVFFDRGIFWVLPLTYFYISQSARAYLFPPICQIS